MPAWFSIKNLHTGVALEELEKKKADEKRPVRWIQERPNVWRIVYAD